MYLYKHPIRTQHKDGGGGHYTEERSNFPYDTREALNYWRGVREDKFTKGQQQVIAVPNPDSDNISKPFIPGKYNNSIELNKLKSKNTLPRQYCKSEIGV